MKILENKSLKTLNTFGIDAEARYFAEVRSIDDLRKLLGDERFTGSRKLILGGGSNILLTGDFKGFIVKNAIPGVQVTSETEAEVVLKAGAGENWHDLVMFCVKKNYAGLENLSLIPGSVGAAPVQNIGAYGAELKDVFHELEAVDLRSGDLTTFRAQDCAFGYRDSVFKHQFRGQFLITSVSFRLTKLSAPGVRYQFKTEYGNVRTMLDEMKVQTLSLKAMSDAICRIRRAKLPDPAELGNAGSFFKNPSVPQVWFEELLFKYPAIPHYPQPDGTVKIPAGWLVEQCGWKGRTAGRAGCHKTQALVLVNLGGATGDEVLDLSQAIFRSVQEKFGIELSCEVNVI